MLQLLQVMPLKFYKSWALFIGFMIVSFLPSPAYNQECRVHNGLTLQKLAVTSPIVITVIPQKIVGKRGKGSKKRYNVTAKVDSVFPTHHGGIKKKDIITFGPLGKSSDCEEVQVKRGSKVKYLLFLQESTMASFHWINYNPVRNIKKKQLRSLRKVLCKNCLVPPKFKKDARTYKKYQGEKVNLKCKASGKPKPTITWYHNGVLLGKSNTPAEFERKVRKRGGSGSIRINSLEMKHNENIFICQAKNVASDGSVNYTITLEVTHASTTPCITCPEMYRNFCGNYGSCCLEKAGETPHCRCNKGFGGRRCHQKDVNIGGIVDPEQFQQNKRLVAVLGMCLALAFVVFLCMGVFYLFKKKRSSLQSRSLINSDGANPTRVKTSDPLVTNGENFDHVNGEPSDALVNTNHVNQTAASEVSSTYAVPDEPHDSETCAYQREDSRSVDGVNNNSTRPRLNGIAKNMRKDSRKGHQEVGNESPKPTQILKEKTCLSPGCPFDDELINTTKSHTNHLRSPDLEQALSQPQPSSCGITPEGSPSLLKPKKLHATNSSINQKSDFRPCSPSSSSCHDFSNQNNFEEDSCKGDVDYQSQEDNLLT